MIQEQLIVNKIQNFLKSNDHSATIENQEVSRVYCKLCHEINKDMQACIEQEENGFHNDARRLCDSLNLREHARTLMIENLSPWLEMVHDQNWEIPESIDANTVAKIEQIISENYSRDQLLKMYKTEIRNNNHAQKLFILSELIQCDTNNIEWRKAYQEVQRQRAKEIPDIAKQLIMTHDDLAYQKLSNIHHEIIQYHLKDFLPEKVYNKIEKEVITWEKSKFANDVDGAYLQLVSDSHSDDIFILEQTLAQWQKITQNPLYTPSNEHHQLAQKVEHKLHALQKEQQLKDERQKRISTLEQLLLDHGDVREMGKICIELDEMGGIPDVLFDKYEAHIQRIQRTQSIKERRRILLICIAIFVGLGIIFYLFSRYQEESLYTESMTRAQSLLQNSRYQDFETAQQILRHHVQAFPKHISRSEFISLSAKAQEKITRYLKNVQLYQAKIDEIHSTIQKKSNELYALEHVQNKLLKEAQRFVHANGNDSPAQSVEIDQIRRQIESLCNQLILNEEQLLQSKYLTLLDEIKSYRRDVDTLMMQESYEIDQLIAAFNQYKIDFNTLQGNHKIKNMPAYLTQTENEIETILQEYSKEVVAKHEDLERLNALQQFRTVKGYRTALKALNTLSPALLKDVSPSDYLYYSLQTEKLLDQYEKFLESFVQYHNTKRTEVFTKTEYFEFLKADWDETILQHMQYVNKTQNFDENKKIALERLDKLAVNWTVFQVALQRKRENIVDIFYCDKPPVKEITPTGNVYPEIFYKISPLQSKPFKFSEISMGSSVIWNMNGIDYNAPKGKFSYPPFKNYLTIMINELNKCKSYEACQVVIQKHWEYLQTHSTYSTLDPYARCILMRELLIFYGAVIDTRGAKSPLSKILLTYFSPGMPEYIFPKNNEYIGKQTPNEIQKVARIAQLIKFEDLVKCDQLLTECNQYLISAHFVPIGYIAKDKTFKRSAANLGVKSESITLWRLTFEPHPMLSVVGELVDQKPIFYENYRNQLIPGELLFASGKGNIHNFMNRISNKAPAQFSFPKAWPANMKNSNKRSP